MAPQNAVAALRVGDLKVARQIRKLGPGLTLGRRS